MDVVCSVWCDDSSGAWGEVQILSSVWTPCSYSAEGCRLLYLEGGSGAIIYDPDLLLCSPTPVSVSAFLSKPVTMSMASLCPLVELSYWAEYCSPTLWVSLLSTLPLSWFCAAKPSWLCRGSPLQLPWLMLYLPLRWVTEWHWTLEHSLDSSVVLTVFWLFGIFIKTRDFLLETAKCLFDALGFDSTWWKFHIS